MKSLLSILILISFLGSCSQQTNPKGNITPKDTTQTIGNKPDTVENEQIKIASFNIQVFGQSKLGKAEVMQQIVGIIDHFDACAIQEIRSTELNILPKLVEMLGNNWDYRISRRLGRTASKEQYGLVFRKNIIQVTDTFQTYDPQDKLHREPFVFYCKSGDFDFSLINIHTDPDEIKQEFDFLDDIFRSELQKEKDAIMLGDFNADGVHFQELGAIPGIMWAISGIPTNISGTETYDNMVFMKTFCKEFKQGFVYNFKDSLYLTLENAKKISDHFPVYGVFEISKDDD